MNIDAGNIIDISINLSPKTITYPGDPAPELYWKFKIADGCDSDVGFIHAGLHHGTHVDAPSHFVRQGPGVDKMPLDTMVGRARVVEIKDTESIKPEELRQHRIRRGERILFKTHNSSYVWQTGEFVEDFVFISDDAARFLVERGVRLVGVDYLSVGSFRHGGKYVHKTLLSGGVWAIEGLDLSHVAPGNYYLICLPLRLIPGDGAPARAILRPLRSR